MLLLLTVYNERIYVFCISTGFRHFCLIISYNVNKVIWTCMSTCLNVCECLSGSTVLNSKSCHFILLQQKRRNTPNLTHSHIRQTIYILTFYQRNWQTKRIKWILYVCIIFIHFAWSLLCINVFVMHTILWCSHTIAYVLRMQIVESVCKFQKKTYYTHNL